MANFDPLTAAIGLPVWGTPANFNGFRVLASLLQRRRLPEAIQTSHDLWPSPGLVHYIHFQGLLQPDAILPRAEFTLRPSLAFSYIGRVTARHSSSRRQPNFAAWYKNRITDLLQRVPPIFSLTSITLGIGPHCIWFIFCTFLLVLWLSYLPSVLWHCWLVVRKNNRLVKILSDKVLAWLWSSWCHCHPIISCLIKIQNAFTFLVLAYPRYHAKRPLYECQSLIIIPVSAVNKKSSVYGSFMLVELCCLRVYK